MLSYQLEGKILEVKEVSMGWSRDRVTYWYYNIENWMKSSRGKQGDMPDREMTPSDIARVKELYLPKALAPKLPAQPLNPDFDPKAKGRYAAVTASMERDNFYEGRTREECAAEWRRRYDVLKEVDRNKAEPKAGSRAHGPSF